MKNSILSTCLFLLVQSGVFAQANLKIELVSFPDTVIEYMPNTATIKVKNIGLTAYNGPLVVYMAEVIDFFPTDIHNEISVSIPATDSITFNIGNIIFFNPFFKYGNNIVVVWPQGIGCDNDSLQVNVFMKNFVGIPYNQAGAYYISATPNPFADSFLLKANGIDFIQQDLTLRDALGRKIPFHLQGNQVFVEGSEKGLYLLEIKLPDGSLTYKKLLRE